MPRIKTSAKKSAQTQRFPIEMVVLVALGLVVLGGLVWYLTKPKPQAASARGSWSGLMKQYGCSGPGTIDPGTSGGCVKLLQFMIQLGDNHIGGPPKITGNFDNATKAYVTQFQQQNNLSAAGSVDRATWTKLQSCVNLDSATVDKIWTCTQLTP